jgi:hypothetical protein
MSYNDREHQSAVVFDRPEQAPRPRWQRTLDKVICITIVAVIIVLLVIATVFTINLW